MKLYFYRFYWHLSWFLFRLDPLQHDLKKTAFVVWWQRKAQSLRVDACRTGTHWMRTTIAHTSMALLGNNNNNNSYTISTTSCRMTRVNATHRYRMRECDRTIPPVESRMWPITLSMCPGCLWTQVWMNATVIKIKTNSPKLFTNNKIFLFN